MPVSTSRHPSYPIADPLTEEVALVLRAGCWAAAIAPIANRLVTLRQLAKSQYCGTALTPEDHVFAVEALLGDAIRHMKSSETGIAIQALFGLTPASFGKRLKVRRWLAAQELGVATSTLRSEYEAELLALVVWRTLAGRRASGL